MTFSDMAMYAPLKFISTGKNVWQAGNPNTIEEYQAVHHAREPLVRIHWQKCFF